MLREKRNGGRSGVRPEPSSVGETARPSAGDGGASRRDILKPERSRALPERAPRLRNARSEQSP